MFKVSRPYALLSGYYVINCLKLFVVAMAMVVIGDTCVQSIMAIRTIIRLPEAINHYYQHSSLIIYALL